MFFLKYSLSLVLAHMPNKQRRLIVSFLMSAALMTCVATVYFMPQKSCVPTQSSHCSTAPAAKWSWQCRMRNTATTQHTVCRAPFALSADVVIERGIQFHSRDKHLIHVKAHRLALTQRGNFGNCDIAPNTPRMIEHDLLSCIHAVASW